MSPENLKVDIRSLPCFRLAATRHTGPYNSSTAFTQAITAANKQNLPIGRLCGLSYDNPAITPAKNLRSLAGIEITAESIPTKPLELLYTHAGRYAVFEYCGPYERFGLAYDCIYGRWFPGSDETPANHPALDIYLNSLQNTAPEDLRTDICIPLTETHLSLT